MTREERLQPVADLARSREDQAAVAMAQQRRSLEEQQRSLAELQQFEREYTERFQAISRTGISVQRLNEYRRFADKLREAILQQSRVVDDSRRRLEALSRCWSEASSHRQAIDKTIDRFHDQTVRKAARKEQREADDRAQRLGSTIAED
jgi:flagellar export protein FliJ